MDHSKKNDDDEEVRDLLDWTSKQGRILTANGQAEKYYTPTRGYPFEENELPHYYLLSTTHDTNDVFASWARARARSTRKEGDTTTTTSLKQKKKHNIVCCGAWTRTLFVGGFEYSTNQQEDVYNIQTNTLFIDMRIPKLGNSKIQELDGNDDDEQKKKKKKTKKTLEELTNDQLRLYARRHAFAGYTILEQHQHRDVCTRHHCIDWNFVGKGRNRPNKWFVQMHPNHTNIWKEFAFAKDDHDQHYYFEQWERLDGDANGEGLVLALRKRKEKQEKNNVRDDGIIVIVGDHFNYIFSRKVQGDEETYGKSTLVDLIDAAVQSGDRKSAEAYLSIDAGHGTISSGWKIDCALQYWKEGMCLFSNEDSGMKIDGGSDMDSCSFTWNGGAWDVYESSHQNLDELQFLFNWREGGQNAEMSKLQNILFNMNPRKRKQP